MKKTIVEILTRIHQNAQRNINEKLGLNFKRQWRKQRNSYYQEDGRIIEGYSS